MLDVERWADLRREHFVRGVSIKELMRRTGLARNTIRVALRSQAPPTYERSRTPSKLDPFKEEIHELLRRDPKLPGVRVRELIEPLGFQGGKTIVDDYVREVRPLFLPQRTFQRTVYRPGEICQWDLWEPSEPVPVGHGQVRRAYVVVACLGYSRAGSGALIFNKEAPDVLWGMTRCLWSLGALPELMVWDREGCLQAGGAQPGSMPPSAGSCQSTDTSANGVMRRRRAASSASRAISRPTSSPAGALPTTWTSSCSSITGLRRQMRGRTARSGPGRSTAWQRSSRRCGHCPLTSPTRTVAG